MKKLFKVLGATAVLAALVPYSFKKDGDTTHLKALTWSGSVGPEPAEGGALVEVNVGLNSPFAQEEAHLFADELTVNYQSTPSSVPQEEPEEVKEPETTSEDQAPEATVEPEEDTEPTQQTEEKTEAPSPADITGESNDQK
jgi:outer membrane biosynthesis protein TonB